MRFGDVAKLFAGSCVVYFVVAACSAYSGDGGTAGPASSTSGTTGTPTDPTPNAMADGFKSGSRLRLHFWEGTDGAREFINFYDTTLQTECNVVPADSATPDGKTRCLPLGQGTMYFSDTKCTTPLVFVVPKATDPQPKFARVDGMATGGTSRDFYALKGLITPPATGYQGGKSLGQGECSSVTISASSSSNYYEVGAPTAASTFVEMTMKTE